MKSLYQREMYTSVSIVALVTVAKVQNQPPTLSPSLHLSLPSSANLSPHYSSLLHTHHMLTNPLYQLYTTQPPPIPDTSTLHYNRNTTKHTQGTQNQAAPMSLLPLTHPSSCFPFSTTLPISQISIASLTSITPTNSHCL
jgi:hypothetical protein